MADFEATVRLYDLQEHDAPAARREIESRLRAAGFRRWRIVSVGKHGALTQPRRFSRHVLRGKENLAGGGLLVAATAAWVLWFLWVIAE